MIDVFGAAAAAAATSQCSEYVKSLIARLAINYVLVCLYVYPQCTSNSINETKPCTSSLTELINMFGHSQTDTDQ